MDIIVRNLKLYYDISFEEYLVLPGISYSGLKNDGQQIQETEKMRFGTAVHNYLLTPHNLKEIDPKVRSVAYSLKTTLTQPLLKLCFPELAATAEFVYNGVLFKWKGRMDLAIPGRMIIDVKVTGEKLESVIEFFRYDRQVSGYCLALNCPLGFVIAVHPKTEITTVKRIPVDEYFWREVILKYGEPLIEGGDE